MLGRCWLVLFPLLLSAQAKFEYSPGTAYDPAVPTVRKVLGYDAGGHISSPAQIVLYMERLAAARPDRMKLWDYGKTWEGRRLIYSVIGSEANIRRLSEIRDGIHKLADPRTTSEADATRIRASLPVVVWLAYGVHGNEISSSDAALELAYHLLAARNDKKVDAILENTIVMINPLQNPDGRDRFVANYELSAGSEPDPNPNSAEHTESWPGSRTNHYFFDLNRDWLAVTQPESRGHMEVLKQWLPEVYVDLHEMGTDGTYYFAPDADPVNPHLTKAQADAQNWFGKANARLFDQLGFSYFTREMYDAFYPGYTASWPAYYGAVSMTYENGSARGLVVRRPDDAVVSYRDTVRRHFLTSLETCDVAAQHRANLLDEFWRYRKSAIEEGSKEPVRDYILVRDGDVTKVDELAQLMIEQGAEVKRASESFRAGGRQIPAGSYVISLAQPAKRLIHVLLDTQVPLSAKFLKAEEARRKSRRQSEIYDVTAWSLPLQFNVQVVASPSDVSLRLAPVKAGAAIPGRVSGKATVVYVVPWGTSASGRMLTALLRQGYRVLSNDRPFKLDGKTYGSGALILKVKENPSTLDAAIRKLAVSTGADVDAHDTTWVDEGPALGSQHVVYLKRPAVAMAWDRPTDSGSAGQARFVLERQFQYPVTAIRTRQMAVADLSQFQVIILPDDTDEGYTTVLGENGMRRMKEWVRAGGTLIATGPDASEFLTDEDMGLLSSAVEEAEHKPGDEAQQKTIADQVGFDAAIEPDSELPGSLHGAIAKVRIQRDEWVAAGVPETAYALVSGQSIFRPVKADRGTNVAVFADPMEVLASGYMWDEYRKQLAFKPFLIVEPRGRGQVIAFTADPNYRGSMNGLNLLFLNAIFRGPAHSGARAGSPTEARR